MCLRQDSLSVDIATEIVWRFLMRKQLLLLSSVCVMAMTVADAAHSRRSLVTKLPSVQIHYEALDSLKRNDYRIATPHIQSQPVRKPIVSNPSTGGAAVAAAPTTQPQLKWQVGPPGQKVSDLAAPKVKKPINAASITPKASVKRAEHKAAPKPTVKKKEKAPSLPPLSPKVSLPKATPLPVIAPNLPPLQKVARTPKPSPMPEMPPINNTIAVPPPVEMPKLPPLEPTVDRLPPPGLPKSNLPPLKSNETFKPSMPKLPDLPPLQPLPTPKAPTLKVTTKPAIDLPPLKKIEPVSPPMPKLPPLAPKVELTPSMPELPALNKEKTEVAPPPLPKKLDLPPLPKAETPSAALPPLPEKLDLPPLPKLPPKKNIVDTAPNLPDLPPAKAAAPNLPPLPNPSAKAPELPPLPVVNVKKQLPDTSTSPELPPLPNISNVPELPDLPPLPSLSGLKSSGSSDNKALDLAQKHNKTPSLPPLPGEKSKTESFVKKEGSFDTAAIDSNSLPPLPVRKSEESSVDNIKSNGAPRATISFSQMERAVPLTSYPDLKTIASEVKKDESKGVTILAYAYGSNDQSQLAKRAALARMMAVRTFLIEEGGLDQTQINAMTPKQDAHPDGKERVDIFIR